MWKPAFVQKFFSRGSVLINAHNKKNEHYLKTLLKQHNYYVYFAPSFAAAKNILENKKILGVVLDHTFRHDPEHTGENLVAYIRKENENLRGLPVFLVASVETMVLQEYEYLKINQYFDTEKNRVKFVVEEMVPYFILRD